MSDEQEIDFGAEGERGDEPPRAKPQLPGWEWWPAWYDERRAYWRAEEAQMKALNFALDKLFGKKP
jgi:hypothetical protein